METSVWLAIISALLSVLTIGGAFAATMVVSQLKLGNIALANHIAASTAEHGVLHSHISQDRVKIATLEGRVGAAD